MVHGLRIKQTALNALTHLDRVNASLTLLKPHDVDHHDVMDRAASALGLFLYSRVGVELNY